MERKPVIITSRLLLRRYTTGDAEELQKYAGNQEISRILPNIPHPYSRKIAQDWIVKQEKEFIDEISLAFAITEKQTGKFMGSINLFCDKKNNSGSLGYWMGLPFWNRGFCTEAAQAMIGFGFRQMGFHRIWAEHWAANPASGRVMEKCGMRKESILVEKELRNGEYRDIVQYAILRREWEERKTDPPLEIQTIFC